MQEINFLAIWWCSSVVFIVLHFSCFIFYWDTINIRKHHLKKLLQKYSKHLKLRKTLTCPSKIYLEKFILQNLYYNSDLYWTYFLCICIYSFSTFFLNTSVWLLPSISNLSFILDIFRKKPTLSTLICYP